MDRRSLAFLLAFIFLTFCAFSLPSPAPAPATDDNVKPEDEVWTWCVEDEDDMELCNKLQEILDQIDDDKEHIHNCTTGGGDEGCMAKIMNGTAKFGIFDGGEVLEAADDYYLIPIRRQIDQNGANGSYYGVGVVKSDSCPAKLQDLKGKKSCHTGYGRSAGWVLPVTYLIDNNIMPVVDKNPQVKNDIESVEAFFSKSCAANDDPSAEICTACVNTTGCTEEDPYYDYAGAFRCLVEGSGDVAFTKHSIPSLYAKNGDLEQSDWKNLKDSSSYNIICPNLYQGKLCAPINKWQSCNFGAAPGHTIMVSKNFDKHEIQEFNDLMDKANNNESFKALFSGKNLESSEFAAGVSSTVPYNGTVDDLLGSLKAKINELQALNAKESNQSAASLAFSISTTLLQSLTLDMAALFLVALFFT